MNITDIDKARLDRNCPMLSRTRGAGLGTALQNIEKLASLYDPDRILRVNQLASGSKKDGSSWDEGFTTLMAAINKARYIIGTESIDYTDTHHVYIFVAPGNYSAEGRIAFSAKNIHIIGLGVPGGDTGVSIIPVSPSGFAFGGSGSGVEIANIFIGVSTAIQALFWDYMDACWFHDIVIGDLSGSPLMAYGVYTNGFNGSILERVRIMNPRTAGIHVHGGADKFCYGSVMRDNMLSSGVTCAKAIFIGSGLVGQMLIDHNFVFGDNFTKNIVVDHVAADVMVTDNYVHTATEGGTTRGEHTS